MDIGSDGSIAVATRASGSPTLMSIEAVFSVSTKGDAAVEGKFTPVSLLSGLSGLAISSGWQAPQCRVSVDKVVECRGLIVKTGGGTLSGKIFTISEDIRPQNQLSFLTVSHGGADMARVDVESNGNVYCYKHQSQSKFCSLDGVRFSLATATSLSLADGTRNAGTTWTRAGFIINRHTWILRGLVRRVENFGINQVGSLVDVALRPRYKRLFNTVSHEKDKPRLIEVRPNGDIFSVNTPGSVFSSLDGVFMTLQPADDFAVVPVQLIAPFTAKPSADGSAPPSYFTYSVPATSGTIRRVRLQGDVVRLGSTAGTTLLQLPGDLRPSLNVGFVASSLLVDGTATVSRVEVQSTGSVRLGGGSTSAAAIALDGIDFAIAGSFTKIFASGYGTTPGYQSLGYAKDDDGRVYLRGQLFSITGTKSAGTLLLTLPSGARPAHGHSFVVNSYSSSNPFLRVDVLPNGQVKVQQAFNVVGLDGIEFDTGTAGWEDLLETLPVAQQAAFVDGPSSFASPGYKVVDNMVYFRGVVKRMVTSESATDAVPVLGYLPQTARPEHNMNYPALALEGIKLHHITVSSSGQIQVQFDAADGLIALDGIAFAKWSGNYGFNGWQFGTDNGDMMQIQRTTNGAITHAFSPDGFMHTGRNGSAGALWAHKTPYNADAVVLGNWIVGPRDLSHFGINHASSGGGASNLLLRSDGYIFCSYKGTVGDRVSALSVRGTVLRVGNWLMGPSEDDPDSFVISKLGTGEVIAWLLKNGDAYLKEKLVTRATLSALTFSLNIGSNNYDPDGITADSQMLVRARNGAAAANLKHTGISDGVIALGNYYIGMKDTDHFVINTKNLNATARPQLVIRNDGQIFTSGSEQNSPAPSTWVIKGTEGAGRVIKFGNWFFGDQASSHFVINRAGASKPQFLLRDDGHLWIGSQEGPPPPSFFLAPAWCKEEDTAAYVSDWKNAPWTVATKSGNAVISRAGAYAPSMVLSESYVTANFKGTVLTGRQLKASDPGVKKLGDWLIGFHADVFVICTAVSAGDNWPQFALDASGNMYSGRITGNAGTEYSLDGPNVFLPQPRLARFSLPCLFGWTRLYSQTQFCLALNNSNRVTFHFIVALVIGPATTPLVTQLVRSQLSVRLALTSRHSPLQQAIESVRHAQMVLSRAQTIIHSARPGKRALWAQTTKSLPLLPRMIECVGAVLIVQVLSKSLLAP
eukprot:m.30182 g.30182  ORF g.30182 m.30182 type:complete len:1203 (-) comp12006_c0_seq4:5609-9217(-)